MQSSDRESRRNDDGTGQKTPLDLIGNPNPEGRFIDRRNIRHSYSCSRTLTDGKRSSTWSFRSEPPGSNGLLKLERSTCLKLTGAHAPRDWQAVIAHGGHVYGIPDMTPEDSGQSLNGLVDEACHGEQAIEHAWTQGRFGPRQ